MPHSLPPGPESSEDLPHSAPTRPRLEDIAAAAGLAVSTVSDALRGTRNVSRRTSERVRAIAQQLGYRPNPLFASLALQRKPRASQRRLGDPIALLTHAPPNGATYGSEIVGPAASQLGYHLTLLDLQTEAIPLGALLDGLYHRGFVGVIIGDWSEPAPDWVAEDWSRFAVVALNGYRTRTPFHTVRNTIFHHMQRAWQETLRQGYSDIGPAICRHAFPLEDDDMRHAAVALEQARLPPGARRIPPFCGWPSDSAGFLAWFLEHRPDAVIGFSCAQYYTLIEAGFTCPQDFVYTCLHRDDLPFYDGLAGIQFNVDRVVEATLDLLDQLIRRNQPGIPPVPRDIQIPSTWRPGPSLPPRASTRILREPRPMSANPSSPP